LESCRGQENHRGKRIGHADYPSHGGTRRLLVKIKKVFGSGRTRTRKKLDTEGGRGISTPHKAGMNNIGFSRGGTLCATFTSIQAFFRRL
jgi:hypothetical protein